MNDLNQADNGFVRNLEWQLRSEIRRGRRFNTTASASRLPGVAKTAVLILLCAATGYAAAMTVEHFEHAHRKELLRIRAETSLEILRARRDMVDELVRDMSDKRVRGLVSATQLAEVEFQSELVEFEIDRARIDLEEVELSGRSPDDALYAPVFGGRDFVTERLQIDQLASVARSRFIEAQVAGVRELVEVGIADQVQAHEIELQLARSESETEDVVRRLELRHAYLKGDVTARQVTLSEELNLARDRLQDAETSAALVQEHYDRISAMQSDGLVPDIQVKEVELRLAEVRAEVRLARAELEYLQETLSE